LSIKCLSCGLVNFADAEVCRRCKKGLHQDAAAGQPPAPTTPAVAAAAADEAPGSAADGKVLGRISTKHGFKDWFVIALEDSVVLTPESVLGSVLHNALPIGARGGLVGALIAWKGGQMEAESKDKLAEAPGEQLRSCPDNVVIPLSDLRSIEFTRHLFSAWVEFVRRAGPTKFEVNHQVYMELCDATQRRFPALYHSDARTAKLLEARRARLEKAGVARP
jgi:hypothetical protein